VLRERVALAGVAGILIAVLTTGCGDEALTKEQYVSKLNAMCADFSEQEKRIGEPQTLADLGEKGPRILDAFENAIVDKVDNLKPPDEIAGQADRMADLAHQQRDVLSGLVDAAKANDLAKVQELSSKNAALNQEANAIARDLGATSCAED
jgi:hypothetical protein